MNTQEQKMLNQINSEEKTPAQISRASKFLASVPYTAHALRLMAEVAESEYECPALYEALNKAADMVAAVESTIL
jgi:hypothetical protein